MRTVCCAMVLLTGGIAQSAPPEEITSASQPTKRIRFLSLAEARATALLHGSICGQPSLLFPGVGLDDLVSTPQGSVSRRVLADFTHGTEGILVTNLPHNTPQAELERNINQLLLNIENAYWNLYGSYGQLHSREQGLRFAYESWKLTKAKHAAGTANTAELAQAEGQYDLFRSQRFQALDTVLDNERQLRAMLGMSIEDGTRLVPSDAPTLVEKRPDWDKGLAHTMKHRPELRIARKDLKVTELQPARARASLALQDQELKAERFLGLYYRRRSSAYVQIKAAQAQREAFATQVRVQSKSYRTDGKAATLNLLLEAQRFWADAFATECQAAVTYNNALAGWEYAKGASIKYARVTLAKQPPCGCGNISAVVYQGERTRMKVRRKAAVKTNDALTAPATCSLAALWKRFPPLLDTEEVPTIEKASYRKDEQADKLLTEWKVSDIFPHQRNHAKQRP